MAFGEEPPVVGMYEATLSVPGRSMQEACELFEQRTDEIAETRKVLREEWMLATFRAYLNSKLMSLSAPRFFVGVGRVHTRKGRLTGLWPTWHAAAPTRALYD